MMLEFQLSLYALNVGLCCFTAITLVPHKSQNSYPFIVYFLSLLACLFACEWLMTNPFAPARSFWLLLLMMMSLCVAPSALVLAKSIGLKGAEINVRGHVLLVLIGWVLLIPLAVTVDESFRLAFAGDTLSESFTLIVHTSMLLSVSVFLLQTWWVYSTCKRFLQERMSQNRVLLSTSSDSGVELLRLLLVAVLVCAAISLIRVVYCALFDEFGFVNMMISLFQSAWVVWFCLLIVWHINSQRMGLEHFREAVFGNDEAGGAQKAKYGHSPISRARYKEIVEKLNRAVDQDKIYQRASLSLRELCEYVDVGPHALSQVINESEYGNFYDMINRRRVQLASELLMAKPETTVLDIAFECGFSSKSSFNSAFKKYMDVTPSAFRNAPKAGGKTLTVSAL